MENRIRRAVPLLLNLNILVRSTRLIYPQFHKRFLLTDLPDKHLYKRGLPIMETVANISSTNQLANADEILNNPKLHLDYDQLIALKKEDDIVLIDVREHSEINETGKLPGSIHIPLNDLKTALQLPADDFAKTYKTAKPTNEVIVFSCRSGRRSLAALKIALDLNYTNSRHYKGGWLDWKAHTE